MGGFMLADLHETTTGPAGEACVCESFGVELFEGSRVERVFEMLKGESEVQNGGVYEG